MATKTKNARKLNGEESDSLENNIVRLAMSGKLARATKRAIAAGVAKGLPVTFQRGEKVIKRYPDGREELLTLVRRSHFKAPKGVPIIGKT